MSIESPRVVLVIEDEANIINVISQTLLGMLVEVVSAPDGESGLELFKQLEPDLVLLDLALPGMNGFEVLEAMRELPSGADTPVVVITAHGDSATAVDAREAGANEFLAKPFLPSELRRLVENHLRSGVPESA